MSEQSDSSSHRLCGCDRQSCLLFARLSGEQHGPARVLLAKMGSLQDSGVLQSQELPTHCPLILTRQGATAPEQLKQLVPGSIPKGTGQGGAGMLHRSGGETTPGPTSAQQAGKSSPASATCKVPARTSVSSQRKKAQTLTVQDPRTLQNYRREKLGCKQQGVCRAVTDSSRAQATPLVHSVSDQHQPSLRAHFPKRAPQCQSHTMWDLPALLQSLSKPHPKDDGQTRRLLLPRKMKTTREPRSHSHDLEKP